MQIYDTIVLNESCCNERYEKWSLEKFLIQFPNIDVKFIYKKDDYYYIYCPDIDDKAIVKDNRNIIEHFEFSIREILSRIKLTNTLQEEIDVIEVKDFVRHKEDVIMNYGEPGSLRDLYYESNFALDKTFPQFYYKGENGSTISFCTENELTSIQKTQLATVLNKFRIPIQFINLVKDSEFEKNLPPFRSEEGNGDLLLLPSRYISKTSSQSLLQLCERDEDTWIDNKKKLMGEFLTEKNNFLPSSFIIDNSSCLVEAQAFPPNNIRNYLSLYNHILLVPPFHDKHQINLEYLGVTENELKELISIDKVKLILPHSVDRYDINFLNQIAESKPDNILLSRRLASATICDARMRIPFLFPPFSVLERKAILHGFRDFISTLKNEEKEFLIKIAQSVEQMWSTTELQVHERGAMGTSFIGLGQLMAPIIEQITGRDLFLECFSVSHSIEWAGALSTVVTPYESSTYTEQPMAEILASFYSGVRKKSPPNFNSNMNFATSEILSIDKDIPVVDFAKSFGSNDIDRFRELIYKLIQNQETKEDVREVIDKFNIEISKYEKRSEFYNKWEMKGLIYVAVGEIAHSLLGVGGLAVPFGKWFLSLMTKSIDKKFRASNPIVGSLFDTLKGMTTGTLPTAILVSRMRKKLKG